MTDFENELRVRAAPADDKGARIDAYTSGFLDEREDVIACIGAGGIISALKDIYDRLVDVFECGEHREEQENENP